MRTAIGLPLMLLTLAWACSKQSPTSLDAETSSAARPSERETYKNPKGITYRIERVASAKPETFSMNSDFKMADKNIAKYAEQTLRARN